MAYQIGKVEGRWEQVTIDCKNGKIVEGILENGIVELQSGLRVRVEGGYFTEEA